MKLKRKEVKLLLNRLAEVRGSFDCSQEQLASDLKVSRQTIISIEKGRYNPSLPLALKIAKKFNLHVEDIFIIEEDNDDL